MYSRLGKKPPKRLYQVKMHVPIQKQYHFSIRDKIHDPIKTAQNNDRRVDAMIKEQVTNLLNVYFAKENLSRYDWIHVAQNLNTL